MPRSLSPQDRTKMQQRAVEVRREIKCVVWDLDDVIWDGVLLEDENVALRPGLVELLRTLDERGILLSIASRNHEEAAMHKLEELGIAELFLYPQINWGSKAASIVQIQKTLNISMDAIAFVDDQPFERAEVAFAHPEILCLETTEIDGLLRRAEFTPRFLTADARRRREMYRNDITRARAEERFEGPREEFLATLGMEFRIARAHEEDLRRAEELTRRTSQLNATGCTYSYEELAAILSSNAHDLLVAELEDRFGAYGKIGLALVERGSDSHTLRLLLTSCRVMSRGVGTILLHHVMRRARDAGARLFAHFVETKRNRTMFVTYKFAVFREVGRQGELLVMENDLTHIPEPPPYVTVRADS